MTHIFISGASSGLGSSLYNELIKKDVIITVIGRKPPLELRPKDNFILMDLSQKIEIKLTIDRNASKIIFISNAGIIEPIKLATDVDIDLLKINHQVNFVGPFMIAKELTKITSKKNINLHIINISSGASNKAIGGWSAYCSSKAAVKIALDCLEKENNHVNIEHINPGGLDTEMQKKIRSSDEKDMQNRQDFINLYKEGLLKKPKLAASEIVDQVEKYF